MGCEKQTIKKGVIGYGFTSAKVPGLEEGSVEVGKRTRSSADSSTAVILEGIPVLFRAGPEKPDGNAFCRSRDKYRELSSSSLRLGGVELES